jgi:hypothetical protein
MGFTGKSDGERYRNNLFGETYVAAVDVSLSIASTAQCPAFYSGTTPSMLRCSRASILDVRFDLNPVIGCEDTYVGDLEQSQAAAQASS